MLLRTFRLNSPPVLKALNARYLSVNIAIVGSGPAGFYTAQKLLKNPDVKLDIYEKLPTPFGLVRYGVAPDHADVKNVINSFAHVAADDRVNFYGNVGLGVDIQLEQLLQAYHAVVLCYGSAQDKMLNIEGESCKNTFSARNFVGWYNGLPEDKDLEPKLDCDTACIVGQGNVALDCARILLRPANLEKTDITSQAQRTLANSKINKVYIVGRRGPLQVSFTIKELRELIKMHEGRARIEPGSVFEDAQVCQHALKGLERPRRRITELLLDLSTHQGIPCKEGTRLIFKFLAKPNRILVDEQSGRVKGIELLKTAYNSLETFMDPKARPQDIESSFETLECGLIIRSIGFKAKMVDKKLPIDHSKGSVLNINGRVQGYKRLYCSGWLATGAVGVIAGTLNSSQVTAQSILDDLQADALSTKQKMPGFKAIEEILSRKKIQVVHFNDWLRIDELEKRLGAEAGKPREKLVDVARMLKVAQGYSENNRQG